MSVHRRRFHFSLIGFQHRPNLGSQIHHLMLIGIFNNLNTAIATAIPRGQS
ncbi:hypothetical protein L798_02920 [Zootermopsis nevadensis]|uniref:Uncharacterized protein n=1 Tax=Zootermopsis nevadensis TaxID=136037 RepID=A0A067QGV0_ZOONE|nr:hypothetical protein L798_02920 [Zootermopsis nevadensis]